MAELKHIYVGPDTGMAAKNSAICIVFLLYYPNTGMAAKLSYLYCISIVLPKHRYGSKKLAICIVYLLYYPNTGMAAKT